MTRFIEWDDALSVGIEEIDEQHKVLVGLVNEMHTAIKDHHGSEAVRGILARLAEYTRIHFAVEESLQRILHYPGTEAHKREHEELIKQMRDLRMKVASGQTSISFELLHFLKNWLTQHILGSDKDYGDYFLKLGLNPKLKKQSLVARLWEHLH